MKKPDNNYHREYQSQNRISSYIRSRYFKMVVASAHQNMISKSEAIEDIVKKHFDNLPEKEQEKLLENFERMTKEEKNFPRRLSENSY